MDKIIFGAGEVGKALAEQCAKDGIEILGFCDNAKSKGVMSVKEALELDCEFLMATGDVKMACKQVGRDRVSPITSRLLRGIDLNKYDHYTQFCIQNCIDANDNIDNHHFLRSLDVMITERCTLRCRDCSNLMQYYDKPKDYNTQDVIDEIRRVAFNYLVGEWRIIGGEPFVHSEWGETVDYLVTHSGRRRIVIYTNGTILPKMHEVLESPKVLVHITDYGKLSRNLDKLKSMFEGKVKYHISKPVWTDCAGIKKHNRSIEENRKLYEECCSRNYTLLPNSGIYSCAFQANLSRLGIKSYDCDYCTGRPLDAERIEPAVQITGTRTI